jgi:hypothetical protein
MVLPKKTSRGRIRTYPCHSNIDCFLHYISSIDYDCTITWNIFCILQESGAQGYDLVLVGHSLGAGTAAILAILLQQEYPGLHCYAYSPPGGLLR